MLSSKVRSKLAEELRLAGCRHECLAHRPMSLAPEPDCTLVAHSVLPTLQSTVRLDPRPARTCVALAGALDGVEAAFGMHVMPTVPTGKLGMRPGTIMAGALSFHLNVTGVMLWMLLPAAPARFTAFARPCSWQPKSALGRPH